jgi:two-component system, LytTR family, response regulator
MNKPIHKIRTLIVDDEPLARRWLRKLLAEEADFELLGECNDGLEAIARIKQDHPDLVFLDVQMPGTDGFGVLWGLEKEEVPAIIFVTAYDQYAVEAFRLHALDYLLKPFGTERFQGAIEHARQILTPPAQPPGNEPLFALLEEIKSRQENLEQAVNADPVPSPPFVDRLTIKSSGKISFLKTAEITWIEAAGDYLEIHHSGGQSLIRGKISEIEKKLNPAFFARIHRSTIVNLDQIKELYPLFHGDYQIVLQDKTKVTLSRNYRNKLSTMLDKDL